MMDRRAALALIAAVPALPLAAEGAFGPAVDRARKLDQLRSLVIRQGGETLVAEAFRGPALDAPQNVKSVSKSLVALLLGTAIDRGEIAGVEAPLGSVAPELIPRQADPGVAEITVEDLVTLRAGLERTSGPNYGAWVSSRDWVADALSRPFVAEPGGRMLYSTGSTHVLGAALSAATGTSLHALAAARLGRPLGIAIPPWARDPQGRFLGGNEMALSPMALATIGEAVAGWGRIGRTRIVSEAWLRRSFVPRTRSPWSGLSYGYGWFLGRAAGRDYALARGYGGQVLLIAPDAALAVAITSDPTRPARSGGYFGELMRLIEEDILPVA